MKPSVWHIHITLTLNSSAEQRNLFADNDGAQPKRLCSSPRGYFHDTCSVRALALFINNCGHRLLPAAAGSTAAP